MKKILASLLVLALCAPAMAATITLTNLGGGQAKITVATEAGEANIVGLGLDVDVTGGTVSAVDIPGLVTQKFNIFPDAGYTLGAGYTYGAGSPVAGKTAAGQISLPQSSFALSLANLNGAATAGADGAASVEITLTLTGTQLDVCENATRGGIVAVDGTALVADCATLTLVEPECVANTAPFYADWVAFGKPACWCYAKQCKGDVDGLLQGSAFLGYVAVGTNDLNPFLGAYNIKEPTKGPGLTGNQICADFDHAKQGSAFLGYVRVGTNDLNIFLANYNIKEPTKGPGIGDCAGPDYNFFVSP